jgi:hypothetical protein
MFRTPLEIAEALTVRPVVFATIPDRARMLICVPLALTIELERLRLSADTVNVLVVLPSRTPLAVGISSPLSEVLLKARLPVTVRSPLTASVCLTIT